jgi:hypothetical protein
LVSLILHILVSQEIIIVVVEKGETKEIRQNKLINMKFGIALLAVVLGGGQALAFTTVGQQSTMM